MSLTGNTIFANAKSPTDQVVSGNAPVVTNQNRLCFGAMELKRQLGVKYDTAWMFKQCCRVMKESPMTSSPSAASFSSDDSTEWNGMKEEFEWTTMEWKEWNDRTKTESTDPAFNWQMMIGNEEPAAGSCHKLERSITKASLRNTASGLIITVLTFKSMLLN